MTKVFDIEFVQTSTLNAKSSTLSFIKIDELLNSAVVFTSYILMGDVNIAVHIGCAPVRLT